MALNNLGISYREVGRRQEAVGPTEEAAATYRTLAEENPAFVPDLAMALNNLGIFYREVGREAELDAVWGQVLAGVSTEAREILQALRAADH